MKTKISFLEVVETFALAVVVTFIATVVCTGIVGLIHWIVDKSL